jgi:hypothetical protein
MGLPFTRSLPVRLVLFLTLLLTPMAIQVAHAEEWTTYTDKEAGFSVSYPADWEAKSTPMPEAVLKVKSPEGDEKCMVAHELIKGLESGTLEERLSAYSSDVFIELARTEFGYEDIVVVAEDRRELSGQVSAYLEVTYRKPSVESHSDNKIRTQIFYTVANGGYYTIRCITPDALIQNGSHSGADFSDSFLILRQ